jgi:PhoH-like ATPase
MKKYLIDTSVIIDNPAQNLYKIYQNGNNDIYITDIILKELDKHKTSINNEVGISARSFFRAINKNKFKEVKNKAILKGDRVYKVKLYFEEINQNIKIFIIKRKRYKEDFNNDFKIMEIGIDYKLKLLTNDISFKVNALSNGLHVESMKYDTVLSPENISFFKKVKIEKTKNYIDLINSLNIEKYITQLEVIFINNEVETGEKKYLIRNGNSFTEIRTEKSDFKELKIKPINIEQKFYIELLQKNFKILVVSGSTGSGKTLMAIQEAMRRVKDQKDPINGIVYMRYTINTNDKFAELGFRAGDQNQKLNFYNYPLYSALNFILEKRKKEDKKETDFSGIDKNEETEKLMKDFNISVTDIAHARGITISNKIVIFDEVQNTPNSILKLIGTRMGDNTKIILMGDFKQVDHPYLTKERNALVTMLRIAKESNNNNIISAIQLKTTVRSEVAEWFEENIK